MLVPRAITLISLRLRRIALLRLIRQLIQRLGGLPGLAVGLLASGVPLSLRLDLAGQAAGDFLIHALFAQPAGELVLVRERCR